MYMFVTVNVLENKELELYKLYKYNAFYIDKNL